MRLYMRPDSASAAGGILFLFGSWKFIQHKLVTGEHEQSSSKNGATR
jgi:hypothetical protein